MRDRAHRNARCPRAALVAVSAPFIAFAVACSSGGSSPPTPTAAPVASSTPVSFSAQTPGAGPSVAPGTVAAEPAPVGLRFRGGSSPVVGHLAIPLPAGGGEFIIGAGTADNGAQYVVIYHAASGSRLYVSPDDGHEFQRRIADPAVNSMFDAIIRGIHPAPPSE